jgi:hypothetical protein
VTDYGERHYRMATARLTRVEPTLSHEEIARHLDEFRHRGGRITKCAPGETSELSLAERQKLKFATRSGKPRRKDECRKAESKKGY